MTMHRLAHISDTHVCEHLRIADLARVFDTFLTDVEAAHVDLIVHSGDFYDRRSSPRERLMLANFLLRARHIAPVVGVRGNHDVPGDLAIFNGFDLAHIAERPTLPGEAHPCGPFGLLFLPWFDKAHLVSGLEATVEPETTRKMTIEAAEQLLVGLRAEAERVRSLGLTPIVVAHTMVQGSVTSTGQVMQGTTVELTPYTLKEIGAEYVALGHVHKAQDWFEGRVAYAGSPIRTNFGEAEAKGWRLVTFDDDGRFVSNEFRPLPARQILLLEADLTQAVGQGTPPLHGCTPGQLAEIGGALVRFRYRIGAGQLHTVDEDAIRRLLVDHGAAEVKLEAVVQHEARVRSESIVAAKSIAEKLAAYFEAKGENVTPETQARLADKVTTIEREASA